MSRNTFRNLLLAASAVLFMSADCLGVPRFLTLPFKDSGVRVVQGWVYNFGEDQSFCSHQAIDFIKGTNPNYQAFEVLAAADGEAVLRSSTSYGDYVTVKTNIEGVVYYTLYAHLDNTQRKLQPGVPTYVTRGRTIGVAGKTGASNNILHLHFELSKGNFGQSSCQGVNQCGTCRIDPYGIYGKKELYPTAGDSTCRASDYYWTQCAPAVAGENTADASTRWHPDGTLIKQAGDNTVWLVENQTRRGVTGADIFNNHRLGWWGIVTVPQAEFDCYTPGTNLEGSPLLRRGSSPGPTYLVRDNRYKSAFTSAGVFEGLGFRWEDVGEVADAEIARFDPHPSAPVLDAPFPDGTLISKAGDQTVYVITNGKKRAITSGPAFLKLGYNWANVISGLQAQTVDDIEEVFPSITEASLATCSNDGGGAADEFDPNLSITSHSDGQTVTSSTVTLAGTASDAGRGESGIASVTVNGVRTSGDTATGSGTASWSRAVTLSQGANALTVVATDGSPAGNQTSRTITLHYSDGGGGDGVTTIADGLSNPNDLATDGAEVFWSDWGSTSVKKVPAGGGTVMTLFGGNQNTSGVTFDTTHVYFGHGPELRKAPKAGGASTLLLTSGSPVTSIAVDGASVYWTECNSGEVRKASVNGGTAQTLATGSLCPSGILLSGGSVYWSEQNNPGSIKRVGMGGGSVSVVGNGSNTPGVATDGTSIYWTENIFSNSGKVNKVSPGASPSALVAGLNRPYDLVADSTSVYWAENHQDGAIKQVASGGGSPITLASGLSEPVAVAADSSYIYWVERNGGGNGAGTLKRVAKGTVPTTIQVTVGTNAPGVLFRVDGQTYTSPQMFNWQPGTPHTVAATPTQSGGPTTQYVWNGWSDGGAAEHTVVPSADATFTATYTTQYWISMNAQVGGTVSPGSNWHDSGRNLSITATAGSGYAFNGWTGTGAGAYTGANNPATVTVNGPITQTAAFTQIPVQPCDPGNHALACNGATARASSTLDAGRPASAAINGDRLGAHWGTDPATGSGWHDATNNSFPDWLEVTFAGVKTIQEVSLFSIQDNYSSPSVPTETMTFAQYGVTDFQIEYWDGVAWQVVPNGLIVSNDRVWRKLSFTPLTTSKIRVVVNGALAGHSRLTEVEVRGNTASPKINHALSSNGATARASSTLDVGRPAAAAINGDRRGLHWGTDPATGSGWHDATSGAFPDWLEVSFAGSRIIDEVSVFSLQDGYASPAEPTETMTFTQYGVTAFEVQYWTGSAWQAVPNGFVASNTKLWKKITFAPLETSKIRVWVTGAQLSYSRLTEVEAWGAVRTNVALAANGATAAASSTLDSGRAASAAINGDRKGVHWGTEPATGSGWHDSTNNAYPDWLEVTFDGPKSLTEVNVFTLQDSFNSPADPSAAMTFTLYGLQDFDVEYWTGAAWQPVPGGVLASNNKVWVRLAFAPLTTTKIRVLCKKGLAGYSRITEIEAY